MKIAVWHNLPSGGGKRALFNHVRALKERGHYLEAWTTDLSSIEYMPLSEIITEHRYPVKSYIYEAYNYGNPIKRIQKQISIMMEHYKICADEIESKGFDLIFANSCSFSYMPYIGYFSKIPVALYLGEPYRPLYEAFPENIWQAPSYDLNIKNITRIIKDFKEIYAKRIQVREEINAAKMYKSILVNSMFSRENVLRAYGIDSKVCYLGIDKTVFRPDQIIKEPYVVGLGKISHLKGIHKAIQVISRIPHQSRPILKWISDGYIDPYFTEMVRFAKKQDVQFEPLISISDNEVANVLSKAAVMIYISHLEPFGLAPLEANTCGTYVVATAEGGVRESIADGKNGDLIFDFEADSFAKLINKFVTDLSFARLKGEEALSYVSEKWSWKFMADNIEKKLLELID